MADPLSLISSIAGVASACIKVSTTLVDLGIRYHQAKAAVSSLAAECSATKAILERLSDLVKARPDLLAPRPGGSADLRPTFEMIVQAVDAGMIELGQQIARVTRGAPADDLAFGRRILYLMQEAVFTNTISGIRDQRATLAMLLSCIQSETLSSIQVQLGQRPVMPPSSPSDPIKDMSSLQLGDRSNVGNPSPSTPKFVINLKKASDHPVIQKQLAALRKKSHRTRRTDPKYVQKLHSAIDDGSLYKTNSLLLDRVDANLPLCPGGATPLQRAIEEYSRLTKQERRSNSGVDRASIVSDLVLAGADNSAEDGQGRSCLSLAASVPELELTFHLMLEFGANPMSRDTRMRTPLHHVAMREPEPSGEGESMVRLLVAYGADINAKDAQGSTPLIQAAISGCEKRARQLVALGADLAAVDARQDSALGWAVWKPFPNMVKMLCNNGAFPDAIISAWEGMPATTCLDHAVAFRRTEVARILIKAGADVNTETRQCSPLITAVASEDFATAKLLLQSGANTKLKSKKSGRTALHYAVKNTDLMLSILAAGSPVDPIDLDGFTPLAIAAEEGREDAVKLLIEHGADIDHHINENFPILRQTIIKGQISTAKLLLANGARVDGRMGPERLGYMHVAAAKGINDLVDLLLDHGASVEDEDILGATPIYNAAANGHTATVKYLLSKGADIRKKTGEGVHILLGAATQPVMLRYLLSLGLDVNEKDAHNTTALHIVAYFGHLAGARILLQHGAVQFHCGGVYETTEDLLAKNTDKALQGTPAEIARQKGHDEVAALIENWRYT